MLNILAYIYLTLFLASCQ